MLRAFLEYADTVEALGNVSGAEHWRAYATAGGAFVRSALGGGSTWTVPGVLGVHAAAEALNVPGFASPAEVTTVLAQTLDNLATICSASNFNSYFILQGLGTAGALDKAADKLRRCWGAEVALGASCFWEISNPEWRLFMRPAPSAAPWGYNGNTSLCHPWSSGAAPFMSKHMLGVTPLRPGFVAVAVAPHVPLATEGIAGGVPTPHGAVAVRVSRVDGGVVDVDIPTGCADGASLRLSEVLLERLGWLSAGGVLEDDTVAVSVDGGAPLTLTPHSTLRGPRAGPHGERCAVAEVMLRPGAHSVRLVSTTPATRRATAPPSAAPAFPPLQWPARVVAIDTATQGAWRGVYGADGYALFGFSTGGATVKSLPPWVKAVTTMDAYERAWEAPPPAADPRALQDPFNATSPRAIGYLECGQNQLPQFTFGIDVALAPESEGSWYQLAVYLVDYDLGLPTHTGDSAPRRLTLDVKRGWPSLDTIAPTQYLGPEVLRGGVWLVLQLNSSARIRVSQLPGATAVASAIAFDGVASN